MPPKNVTIKDIAASAGVSAMAVSMALNDKVGVSAKTRERIKALAAEMGYQPDLLARSMISRKSQTLGVLINSLSDPFFAALVEDIEVAARQHNYNVMVCNVNNDSELEQQYIRMLIGKRVDGILCTSVKHDSKHIGRLVDDGFPFVLVGRTVFEPGLQGRFNSVTLDNYKAGFQAAIHFYRIGHDRIAILSGAPGSSTSVERSQGSIDGQKACGLEFNQDMLIVCGNSTNKAYEATKRLMELSNPPSAIIAHDDHLALSSREALLDSGFRIPEQVGLMGFDDTEVCSLTGIELTSIREKKETMAKTSIELLVSQLAKPADKAPIAAQQIILETELVIRNSCGYKLNRYLREV